jgi:hypothetical protein
MDDVVRYYAQHGVITNPQEHADLFTDLPHDVPALCGVVQGLLFHPAGDPYNIDPADERLGDQNIRRVAERLARIRAVDARPLQIARPAEHRSAAQCYGFATLLCAMLRQQGMPVRVRSGFARYLATPDLTYNHWVCEYWRDTEHRWVLVDAELDGTARRELGVTFDPYDLPRSEFHTAGEIWQQCRAQQADPQQYGFDAVRGFGYIGCQLVHDLACLNNVELLATDRWGLMNHTVTSYDDDTMVLLDHVAALTVAGNAAIPELRRLYDADARLCAPVELTQGRGDASTRAPTDRSVGSFAA